MPAAYERVGALVRVGKELPQAVQVLLFAPVKELLEVQERVDRPPLEPAGVHDRNRILNRGLAEEQRRLPAIMLCWSLNVYSRAVPSLPLSKAVTEQSYELEDARWHIG